MVETDIIFTEIDQLKLIEFMIESDATIVPYLAYSEPKLKTIYNSHKMRKMIKDRELYGPFFLSWRDYNAFPYEFDKIEREEGLRYFLKQREGGPYIDFLPCREVEKEGKHIITSGFVGYYSKYWISKLGKDVPVCDELKEKYKKIIKYIRKISSPYRTAKRKYWIGDDALHCLQSGSEASVNGLNIPAK